MTGLRTTTSIRPATRANPCWRREEWGRAWSSLTSRQEATMLEDPEIPAPANLASPRAVYQALAQRLGVLAPGETLSDELMAFAEEIAHIAKEASDGGRGTA